MDWVSVEESLPEEYKKVLTYREDGEIRIDLMINKNLWLFELDEWEWDKITHWMDLPSAPETN
jgi:hypothetical protein